MRGYPLQRPGCLRQLDLCQFCNGSSYLDACRTSADDGKTEQAPPLIGIFCCFGALERMLTER